MNEQNEQSQIVKEATDKVNALFNGENLADGVNQDKINEAQTAVDKVKDAGIKKALQDKISKAQSILDKVFKITNIDPYIVGDSQFVTGSYTGKNAAYIRVVVNGEKKQLVSMSDNGKLKYYISGLKATDKVSVVIYDKQYKQLAEATVPIKEPETVKITKIDSYLEGKSQFIRGEYTGNEVAYIRVVVNGENKQLVPIKETGKFEYYIPGLKESDKVSIELFDSGWKKIAESNVDVEKPAQINAINSYEEGKTQFVSGSYTGKGARFIRLVVNGKKQALIPMQGLKNNSFSYYMPNLKTSDKVTVVIFDDIYQVLAEKTIFVTK